MKVPARIFKGLLLVLLMIVSSVPLLGQEGSRDEPRPDKDVVKEDATTTGTNKSAEGGAQDPAQSNSSQTKINGYVFPTAEERKKRYLRSVVGPFAIARVGVSAGLNQLSDSPEEWGQGAEGYGKRFASQFGKNVIRQSVIYGLSEAMKLDTGFQKSKRKGFLPRLSDALVQTVTSRTRSGKRVLSAPIFAGTYAGEIIRYETWYPSRYSYKDGLRSGTYSFAKSAGLNVVREFVINW
ncbi:MAG TPA: hypothetical protein VIB00_11770 [Pyrinomonadaceae bacterium]